MGFYIQIVLKSGIPGVMAGFGAAWAVSLIILCWQLQLENAW
jgi:hypothetical protein